MQCIHVGVTVKRRESRTGGGTQRLVARAVIRLANHHQSRYLNGSPLCHDITTAPDAVSPPYAKGRGGLIAPIGLCSPERWRTSFHDSKGWRGAETAVKEIAKAALV